MRHRDVVTLKRERTKLDGQERGGLIGVAAHVISGSRDSGGARDATETEDRDALDVRR